MAVRFHATKFYSFIYLKHIIDYLYFFIMEEHKMTILEAFESLCKGKIEKY